MSEPKQCHYDTEPPLTETCFLSGLGSEILTSKWESLAVQCDQTADQLDAVTKHLVCSYREKARAYRKCIEDLRRQVRHEIRLDRATEKV